MKNDKDNIKHRELFYRTKYILQTDLVAYEIEIEDWRQLKQFLNQQVGHMQLS